MMRSPKENKVIEVFARKDQGKDVEKPEHACAQALLVNSLFHILYAAFLQWPQGRYPFCNAWFSQMKKTLFSFFIFLPEVQDKVP